MTLIFSNLMSENVRMCAEHLDFWIKTTDAIMDRAIKPEFVLDAAQLGVKAFGWINKCPGLWDKLENHLLSLLEGAKEDADYIPGQNDRETDRMIWTLKAGRLSVDFACVCYNRPELDTPGNWAWVKEAQEVGLKLNDCQDILSERYEDLIQVRRNWVLLSVIDKDIFINWRNKIGTMKKAALEVLDSLNINKPADVNLFDAHTIILGLIDKTKQKYKEV